MLFGKGSAHRGRPMLTRSKSIGGITSFSRASSRRGRPRFSPYKVQGWSQQVSSRVPSEDVHELIPSQTVTNKPGRGSHSCRKHGRNLKGKMESQQLGWSISEVSASFRDNLFIGQSDASRKSSRNREARSATRSSITGKNNVSCVEGHSLDFPSFNISNIIKEVKSTAPQKELTQTEKRRPEWSKAMDSPTLRLCVPQQGPRIQMCSPSLFRRQVCPIETPFPSAQVTSPRENIPILQGVFPEINNNTSSFDLNMSDDEQSRVRGQCIGNVSPCLDENYSSEEEEGGEDISHELKLRKADTVIFTQHAENKDCINSWGLTQCGAKDRMMGNLLTTRDDDSFIEFFGTDFSDFEKDTELRDCVPTKSFFLDTVEPALYSPPPRDGAETGLTPFSSQILDLLPLHGTYTCAVCDTYLELMPFTCERSEFDSAEFHTANKEGDVDLYCPQCQCERCVFNFPGKM